MLNIVESLINLKSKIDQEVENHKINKEKLKKIYRKQFKVTLLILLISLVWNSVCREM